jgi:hypothetical protein
MNIRDTREKRGIFFSGKTNYTCIESDTLVASGRKRYSLRNWLGWVSLGFAEIRFGMALY